MLCAVYIRKIEKKEIKKKAQEVQRELQGELENSSQKISELSTPKEKTNFFEESISMLERTSLKLYPIIKEVIKRMIDETKKN